jgi:hypothetical protein
MSVYRKLAEKALTKVVTNKLLNESLVYPDNMQERMHPKLEEDLVTQRHSLGKHPAIPEGDEESFEQKIIGKRFSEVCRRYKRAFDVTEIDSKSAIKTMMPLVYECIAMESKHKKALEKLAVEMIREEYDMDEESVEIIAELTSEISLEGTSKNPKPMKVDGMTFENHDDIVSINDEVYKRRFLNAMIQGAAKKCNHMFHMVDDELSDLDPRLPNRYNKMMSAADYAYYVIPKIEEGVAGGVVKVEFPTEKEPKAKIYAQALVFPVLIHEIVKGVMELLSAHGLPKDKKVCEYVINKADFLAAEPWDMRLGPALWERFTDIIDPDDFKIKHQIFVELALLPADEFHKQMKEILAATKTGYKIIKEISDRVKTELVDDEYNSTVDDYGDSDDNDYEEFL